MKFMLSVLENFYLDDYNDGEVDGSFQINLIEQKFFSSIKEAVRHFYDQFGGSSRGIYKLNEETGVRFGISFMARSGEYGFEELTESEIEMFKNGEIRVYNVEYLAKIEEIKQVEDNDVNNALEGIGFEINECC